jgi:hypothetical protein
MMAISDPNFARNLAKMTGLREDWGFFNINIDTAMGVNAKYKLGATHLRGVVEDLVNPRAAIRYAAAYMKDVKANLDPHLAGVSEADKIGEYVQGWRQGYARRIATYTPGVPPKHGMEHYKHRVDTVTKLLWSH